MTLPGSLLVSFPHEDREASNYIGFSRCFTSPITIRSMLLPLLRLEEVPWSDDSCIGWIPYSCDTTEVRNVPGSEWVHHEEDESRVRYVIEKYAEIRVFVHAWLSLLSVADARHQFMK